MWDLFARKFIGPKVDVWVSWLLNFCLECFYLYYCQNKRTRLSIWYTYVYPCKYSKPTHGVKL